MSQTAESTVEQAPQPSAPSGGNGVGIAAFVAGALALAPLALILGIIGLLRYRSGKASRRSWPLAGTILGAVGMVAGAVIGVLYATSDAPYLTAQAQAKIDAVTVGNAVVDHYVANPGEDSVELEVTDDGYLVAGEQLPTAIVGDVSRALSYTGTTAYDWCLTVTATGLGGDPVEVSFAGTAGLVDSCPAA